MGTERNGCEAGPRKERDLIAQCVTELTSKYAALNFVADSARMSATHSTSGSCIVTDIWISGSSYNARNSNVLPFAKSAPLQLVVSRNRMREWGQPGGCRST